MIFKFTLCVQSLSFPLEWVMLKVLSLCSKMVIVWDDCNGLYIIILTQSEAQNVTPPP